MYTLQTIRTTNTEKGDGRYAEALITIVDENTSQKTDAYAFVHWEAYINRFSYSLSYVSPYDNMNTFWDRVDNVEYIEKFDLLEEACDSDYFDLYHMLDQLLYIMAQGPRKPSMHQAKMLDLTTSASVESSSKFEFAVTQILEYGGEEYEASYSTMFYNKTSIQIKRGDVLLEKYEELQDAGSSEWFMLFCKLKKELVKFIFEYRKENPTLLSYSTVLWDLIDEQTLNDIQDGKI